MNVVSFLQTDDGSTRAITHALGTLSSTFSIEMESSIAKFLVRISQQMSADAVAVLHIADADTLCRLDSVQYALDRCRLILIIDTADKRLVAQAHRLHPRVVLDVASAAQEVPPILLRMERLSCAPQSAFRKEDSLLNHN